MKKIGGWWLANIDALSGETVLWSCLANRSQSANRAVGGKLILTNHRLVFTPHLLDYALAGQKWYIRLDEIEAFGKEPKSGSLFDGGLRDRLRVGLKNKKAELFVVNKLDSVIERLRSTALGD